MFPMRKRKIRLRSDRDFRKAAMSLAEVTVVQDNEYIGLGRIYSFDDATVFFTDQTYYVRNKCEFYAEV
jgi:dolichyl-phosphate-mannose--protein O-mannosyl transferase